VANMPPLTVLPKVDREKAATLVLARAMPSGQARSVADQASPPAVVSMDYGRGKIVAVLGEGLWKWSILPPEMKKFDGVYDSFWSNLVRWLAMGGNFMPGQQVSLELGGASFQLGDPVLANVACKFKLTDAFKPKLSVVGPGGKSEGLVLRSSGGSNSSRLQAVYKPKALGVYRVVLETPGMKPEKQEKKFSIYNIDLERLQTSARPAALQTLAEQSGGQFLPADQADRFPEALARQRQLRIVPRRPKFIWDKGLLLFLLVTWAGAEWLARRQVGLL